MVPPLTYSTVAAIDVANSGRMRAGLAALAANNLGKKRGRMRREQAARISHANLRPAPGTLGETSRPCEVPVTFKAERKPRRVVRAATSTAPEPVKAPDHQPIKAAELDAEMKAAARRIMQADGRDGWRLVGVMNRESGRVKVYVRKHGASVRYSTAA
ncbi:hypothetical protein ACWD7Y_04680 [Streptomyces drozdowiczii]